MISEDSTDNISETAPKNPSGIAGEELPPKPNRGGRPKGYSPKKKDQITKLDVELPIAVILMNLTTAIATRAQDDKYIMTLQEAKAIEEGFNTWVKMRLPLISKYYPEVILITPIIAYGMRVLVTPKTTPPEPDKNKK